MASLPALHGTPSEFASPHRHTYRAQFTLHDLPAELSSTQVRAKQVLAQLLSRLKDTHSEYYKRYGKWIETHPKLQDFCFQCVRPQVWNFLQGSWSLETLKTIGGDLKFPGRGIYLNGVLGLDKRVRIYIGQATSIRWRIAQHLNFRYRRDNPSLHYLAMEQSTYNSIGSLALLPSPNPESNSLPGMDRPDLLLNVLEMWMCLVFQSLPPHTLKTWLNGTEETAELRIEGRERKFGALNIADPLNQGDKGKNWVDLSHSDDPLVLEYISMTLKSRRLGGRKKTYIESAKIYVESQEGGGSVISGPQRVVLGGLAVGLAIIFFSSKAAGPQPKFKRRIN